MAAALDSWHDIIRNGDASTLDTLIADDAVFHSPVVHTPQVGKTLVVKYLTAAANVLLDGSFKYLTEMVDERQAMLEFQVTLDDIVINGVDHIRWNDNNQIIEFKVWVRPLKGMQKLHQAMAKQLET
ncbi:MAG: nuclear transport factor 2 family protein [Pseudomonadota bacterium]|nr:nuclear transport factor 2 family protein [Pseudomonadota bacterium]